MSHVMSHPSLVLQFTAANAHPFARRGFLSAPPDKKHAFGSLLWDAAVAAVMAAVLFLNMIGG